jgi:hypothetical protein
MKKLVIVNRGLLEVEALTLLGASTKRNDSSKIGMFGSGNKYALAYLTRNDYKVRISSGGVPIRIGLQKATLKGQEFDVLCINGKRTSITTEFGYNWTLWQAVRELFSNAVDEGLLHFGVMDAAPECAPDTTQITVDINGELEQLLFNISDYLSAGKQVVFESKHGQILRKHGKEGRLYYRGILVHTHPESVFDYNVYDIHLNESREADYSWQIGERIWKLLYACTDRSVIRQVLAGLHANNKVLEANIDGSMVDDQSRHINSTAWNEALADMSIAPANLAEYVQPSELPHTWLLPTRLFSGLVSVIKEVKVAEAFKTTSRAGRYHSASPDGLQAETMRKAQDFLRAVNLMPPQEIRIVEFHDKSTLASIDGDVILIGTNCLNGGVHLTAVALMEEQLHITSGLHDLTRSFQNAIFEAWLNYAKTVNAIVI